MDKLQLMDIRRQHEEHGAEYEEAALKVLRSGAYIGGAEVTAFEEEFAAYEGAKYGISCGNGTDALVIALRALGIGSGDEVITVASTFYATAESIAAVGAVPVFIDILPNTLCMDPGLIEGAINSRTKAVLPVHLYGQSCDMDPIRALCRKHGLFLITDCAQSAGTRYQGSRKNTLGDLSCFSFFPTKNLGCDGDGGMILTDDEDLAKACRSLKVHGSGRDGLFTLLAASERMGRPLPADMPRGESKYYNYLVGYNSRLDALQAAILRKKLPYLESFVEKRRANAAFYNSAFQDSSLLCPAETEGGYHSYYLYALRHEKTPLIMKKLKEAGVPCGTYYPVPLHLQGAFAPLGYHRGDLPVTEALSDKSFVLPVFPELYEEERLFVAETLLSILALPEMNT